MKKKWLAGILTLLLAVMTVVPVMPVKVSAAGGEESNHGIGSGTTYYVSSENGNDSNSGTSEGKPFKTLDKINEITLNPGDRVLLENGSVFEDQYLHIKGSGSEDAYIEIATYGDESKGRPQINTNGKGVWDQDYGAALDNVNHKYKGKVSTSVLLFDVEYVEVRGLEITNDRKKGIDPADEGLEYNDYRVMDRTGVAGVAQNKGTLDHIVLDDLYIHDVTGNVQNKHMANGGIYFIVQKPENESVTGIAKYDDLVIENCYLDRVNRWGIAAAYTTYHGEFSGEAEIQDEKIATYGATNVVIQNNYIKNAGGDSITTMYCDRPIVQNNVSENAALQIRSDVYDAPGMPGGASFGRVAAAIWPWKCKNAVFQYNECFNTLNAASGNGDGQAWDADWGDGTLYQYNYSHGNSGGPVMFCGVQAVNNTFRYNISYKDSMGMNPAGNPDAHVYNNIFYMPEGVDYIRTNMSGGYMKLENNIIYYDGEQPKQEEWYKQSTQDKFKYDNNLYYNYANKPDNDENAVVASKGEPLFGDLSKVPVTTNGVVNPHNDPNVETVFDGFKLNENAKAINAGKVITDANGFAVEHDFFGHSIGMVPDIGASESDVVSLVLKSDVYTITNDVISGLARYTTLETFLANVNMDQGVKVTVYDNGEALTGNTDLVKGGMTVILSYQDQKKEYTIEACADNTLIETVYMTDETEKLIYVPYTEENPTTAGEMVMNVTVHETATVFVESEGNAIAYTDKIADGMVLCITAENGTRNTYTIRQKNSYQWALDYAGPQQGNVWFGQMRNGNGEWENITAYDSQYPNWQVNTYYGAGIDEPDHTTKPTENTHGLISAPPETGISTAMSFRAPKSGMVSFSVKDDEPYLRQNGNAGGTVTLSLLVNGDEKQSVILEQSMVKAQDWKGFTDIEVNEGDFIRVAVICNENPLKPSVHITPLITYQDVKTTDTVAPTVPRYVHVTDVTESSAKAVWEESVDNTGVEGYNIYLNDSETPVNSELVTELSYELTGLNSDTEYTVKIEAVDRAGNRSGKSETVFTTGKGTAPAVPAPPAGVGVLGGSITKTGAVVVWNNSADASGYNVYLNENGSPVNGTALITGTRYELKGLTPGTEYTVIVEAVNEAGTARAKTFAFRTLPKDTTDSKNPDKPDGGNSGVKGTPKTGDAADAGLYIVLLLAGAGLAACACLKKRAR